MESRTVSGQTTSSKLSPRYLTSGIMQTMSTDGILLGQSDTIQALALSVVRILYVVGYLAIVGQASFCSAQLCGRC